MRLGRAVGNECIALRVLPYFTNSWVCGPTVKGNIEDFQKNGVRKEVVWCIVCGKRTQLKAGMPNYYSNRILPL